MGKAIFNPDLKNVLDQVLLEIPGVASGKMFGYPAYYIRDKLFACLYENGVGIKVPQGTADDLVGGHGITYFQPLGRARMRSWIFLERRGSTDYVNDRPLFMASIEYVSSLVEKRENRKT
jgi:hypothetical protein